MLLIISNFPRQLGHRFFRFKRVFAFYRFALETILQEERNRVLVELLCGLGYPMAVARWNSWNRGHRICRMALQTSAGLGIKFSNMRYFYYLSSHYKTADHLPLLDFKSNDGKIILTKVRMHFLYVYRQNLNLRNLLEH